MDPSTNRGRLMKDIVHQASDQLAVVGVVRDPHVVLSGVHAKLQIGFTKAPSWGTVVLQKMPHRCMVLINNTPYKMLHNEVLSCVCVFLHLPLLTFSEDMMACTSFLFRLVRSLRCRS